MTGLAYVLRRLARDRSALLGLILVLLVVLAAILAPVISTHPEAVWVGSGQSPEAAGRVAARHRPHGCRHLQPGDLWGHIRF